MSVKLPRHIPLSARLAILTFREGQQIGWALAALMFLLGLGLILPVEASEQSGEQGLWVWIAGALVLPAIPLYVACSGVSESLRFLELLRRGRQAEAKFESKHREGEAIGEPDSETEVWLSFVDEEGVRHNVVHTTAEPRALEDDEQEVIFYDVHQPKRAVALDYLPGKLELRGDGFVARGAVWPRLVAPTIALGAGAALLVAVALTLR